MLNGHNAIAIEKMAHHIDNHTAVPLLPEGTPGPVRYQQQWWAVLTDATAYQPVTEPATIAMLDRHAAALADSARRLTRPVPGADKEQ